MIAAASIPYLDLALEVRDDWQSKAVQPATTSAILPGLSWQPLSYGISIPPLTWNT